MRRSLQCRALLIGAGLVISNVAMAETMTGCLETKVGGFALNMGDKRLAVTGDDIDFEKHAGHTVKLTGSEAGNDFRVTALEHVSPRCDSAGQPAAARVPTAADEGRTASDQGNSEADLETTAKIRRAIVEDDSLSMMAHNVTIVTRDGKVTLRGNVRSMQEKSAVAAKAKAAAGVAVDDQLTVKPDADQERR